MAVITKLASEQIAKKLTENQLNEILSLQKSLSKKLTEFYLMKIPKEILDSFTKHPNYFNTTKDFKISGNGFNYEWLYTNKHLPYVDSNIQFNVEQSKILLDIHNEIETKKGNLRKLIKDIEVTLLALKTYSKINLEFPEATPFLPNKTSTALTVNIQNLRSQLCQTKQSV